MKFTLEANEFFNRQKVLNEIEVPKILKKRKTKSFSKTVVVLFNARYFYCLYKKNLFLTCFILSNIFFCSFIRMLKYIHLFAIPYYVRVTLTLSWRRPLSYRNQSIDLFCKSNQWTGFYMITALVMKDLNDKISHKIPIQKFAQNIAIQEILDIKS